jgi:hypothetical protein
MVLDVERHGGFQAFAAKQRQVNRLPADVRADAIGGFQRVQKSVAQEGGIASQCVPRLGRQLRNTRNDADDGFRRGGVCFKMRVLASFHQT